MANENVLLVCPTKRKVRPEDNEDLQIVTQHADAAEKCFHPKKKKKSSVVAKYPCLKVISYSACRKSIKKPLNDPNLDVSLF